MVPRERATPSEVKSVKTSKSSFCPICAFFCAGSHHSCAKNVGTLGGSRVENPRFICLEDARRVATWSTFKISHRRPVLRLKGVNIGTKLDHAENFAKRISLPQPTPEKKIFGFLPPAQKKKQIICTQDVKISAKILQPKILGL